MTRRFVCKENMEKILHDKGMDAADIRLGFCCDRNHRGELCDHYVLFIGEELVFLSVREELKASCGRFPVFFRKSQCVTTPLSCDALAIEEIKDLFTEDTVNGGRLCVCMQSGECRIISEYSMRTKAAAKDFARDANRLLSGEELPEALKKEDEKERVCPKCHSPYPDPSVGVCPRCMPKTRLFSRLFPFFRKYRFLIFATVGMILFSNLLTLLSPFLSEALLYDGVLAPNSGWYGQLGLLVCLIVLTHLVMAFFDHIHSVISSRISAHVIYDLKKTIFENLQRLSMSFFAGRQTGSLMTQVNSDAETLYWFFCDGVPYFLTNMMKLLGVVIAMLFLEWRLALLICIPLPLMILLYRGVMRGFSRLHAKNFSKSRRFNSAISDVLSGFRVVKAFARERSEVERFSGQSRSYAHSQLALTVRSNTVFPLVGLFTTFVGLAVWALGGWMVVRHGVTGGAEGISYATLRMLLVYLSFVAGPVSFLGEFLGQLTRAANAMRRLFEVMDTVPDVTEAAESVHREKLAGDIVFERVGFSYEPGRKTLEEISFSLAKGETLGIVGHTGAGKSTVANLLTRLYDPGEGRITVDGVDLKDYSFATLHKNIAIVSQETYLFQGSLMDNIRYARPEATREEVMAAAKTAGAHEFIMALPNGYDTLITSKTRLSGGERQRISIARAVLNDPSILILDEATASMDTATERRIQESLSRMTQGKTTIVIAHRLSTLKNAHRLVVIRDGKMAESGTHNELMQQKGEYYKLYMLQLEALKTIAVGD